MNARNAYLVAAAVNLIIIPFLPPHYLPVNLLMAACFAVLAWVGDRLRPNGMRLYLSLATATVTAAIGSVAAVRSDGMLFTFLGLCLITGFIVYSSSETSTNEA